MKKLNKTLVQSTKEEYFVEWLESKPTEYKIIYERTRAGKTFTDDSVGTIIGKFKNKKDNGDGMEWRAYDGHGEYHGKWNSSEKAIEICIMQYEMYYT